MLLVEFTLPPFLLKNAFQAFKQFLVQIAERIGRLNIREALQLVSSLLFPNAKLPTHPELGGHKAGRLVTPDFVFEVRQKWHIEVKQFM